MAYEFINQYIDSQAEEWERIKVLLQAAQHTNRLSSLSVVPKYRLQLLSRQNQVVYSLGDFYLTVLKGRGKFSAQRKHCAEVLKRLCAPYAKGLGIK